MVKLLNSSGGATANELLWTTAVKDRHVQAQSRSLNEGVVSMNSQLVIRFTKLIVYGLDFRFLQCLLLRPCPYLEMWQEVLLSLSHHSPIISQSNFALHLSRKLTLYELAKFISFTFNFSLTVGYCDFTFILNTRFLICGHLNKKDVNQSKSW